MTNTGFTDNNVAVKLEDAKEVRKSAQKMGMVIVVDENDIMGEPDPASPVKCKSPTAPADVPKDKSHSVASLPLWAQEDWHSLLAPTLLDIAGCYNGEDGGWDIEKDKDTFCLLLQDRVSYQIIPTSQIFCLVSLCFFI